ncbi:hypothetical protein [uncultured Mycobacterium sp.]|uniref:hypothetical protein n=1 Tax=uncultured Mycobacterium sp. TaxID=171292 RepID=UPI0035C98E8E
MMRSRRRCTPLALAATGFVCYSALMLVLERRMRRTGGPGIIPFELAGNAQRADRIMSTWGENGRRAARWSLWLDFGYMLSYGALTALLVDGARRRRGHSAALPVLVVPAVAADAVEGVSLLNVLSNSAVAANARRAKAAALVKFGVLLSALGYVLAGWLAPLN